MKVFMECDEMYPCYSIGERRAHYLYEADLTQEEIDRFNKAEKEFFEIHNIISEKVKEI